MCLHKSMSIISVCYSPLQSSFTLTIKVIMMLHVIKSWCTWFQHTRKAQIRGYKPTQKGRDHEPVGDRLTHRVRKELTTSHRSPWGQCWQVYLRSERVWGSQLSRDMRTLQAVLHPKGQTWSVQSWAEDENTEGIQFCEEVAAHTSDTHHKCADEEVQEIHYWQGASKCCETRSVE